MASTLSRWLRTLDADRLARLLTRRPEALTAPVPRTLGELAGRLQGRFGVVEALGAVPLPAVQVLEAVLAYGCRTRADLAALLGADGLDPALAALTDRALLWEYEDQLAVAGEVVSGLGYPLRLGPQATHLLTARPAAELRGIAAALDLPAPPVKKDLVRELTGLYADEDRIRALAARAPAETRDLLDALAWRGPLMMTTSAPGHGQSGPEQWALRRGLLGPDGWQQLAMPREVAIALRGPGWRPPFDPYPPEPPLAPAEVTAEALAREAAAAAGALLDEVGAVLSAGPFALLKTGGVGAREQRRLARATGVDEAGVRLAIELAHGAGLLAGTADEVLPTERYDDWAAAEPPDQLQPLLVAWLRVAAMPWRDGAVLTRDPVGRLMPELRLALMNALAALPDGRALTGDGYPVAAIRWHAPLLAGAFEDLDGSVAALCREAARLGLVAHGALSTLGRALIALDAAALGQAARDLLDAATPTAIFQADLTAVVPGTPTAELARLLDAAADREARGSASVWRFSPGSVRRALDAGRTAPGLLAALRAAATGDGLPQPLEYLLTDVARRHGAVRVRSVGCVVHAADPATLTELLASRALARLGLRQLAPTVLASTASRRDTLAALRSAGYAPVGEDAAGEPVVERQERRRATAPVRYRPARRTPAEEPPDPAALARALLAAPEPRVPETPETPGPPAGRSRATGTLAALEARAQGLDDGERRLLAHAIDAGTAVRISYVDADGRPSDRVIEEIELIGSAIEAWCQLREDDRMFLLSRIAGVAPP